ncbi:MAG: hypothetical protein H6707_04470 [Deltaproteobacteria bacterium]|nr:hypothetical protein [Deltaproteobacteria bacterium]
MGWNFCSIWVRDRAQLDRQQVVDAVASYWRKQGAKPLADHYIALSPFSRERDQKLAIAISEAEMGWYALMDSERYSADRLLAAHLADALQTEVVLHGVWDVVGATVERIFGGVDGAKQSKNLPYFGTHYQSLAPLAKQGEVAVVAFSGQALERYQHIPPADERGSRQETQRNDAFAHRELANNGDVATAIKNLERCGNNETLSAALAQYFDAQRDYADPCQRNVALAVGDFASQRGLLKNGYWGLRYFEAAARAKDQGALGQAKQLLIGRPARLAFFAEKLLESDHDAALELFQVAIDRGWRPTRPYLEPQQAESLDERWASLSAMLSQRL